MPQRFVLVGLLLIGLGATPSAGQPFRFTPIVDSGTTIPGAGTNFVWFWDASFDGRKIVFRGGETTSSPGVYLYDLFDGSLEVVYDASTNVPGLRGGIRSLDQLQIDDDVVVFRGSTTRGALTFAHENGRLQLAVGPRFGSTANLSLGNGELAFTTDRAFVGPVGGPYTLVASRGDAANGGSGSLEQIFGVRTDPREVYLWAWSGGGDGIFRCHPSGTWELVYHGSDFGPPNPPHREFFLLELDAEDGQLGFYVAEWGTDVPFPPYLGLHTTRRRVLEETLATGMPVPGRAGLFESPVGPFSMDGGHVVAIGQSGDYVGIFATLTGSLDEVLGTDDRLDGSAVTYLWLGRDALEGNAFEDGTRGLYLAEWLGGGPGLDAQTRRLRQPRGYRNRCGETSRRIGPDR